MPDRPDNAIPALRMTAEQFRGIYTPDLRKVDTAKAEMISTHAEVPPTDFRADANPTWPWLPPGVNLDDPRMAQAVFGILGELVLVNAYLDKGLAVLGVKDHSGAHTAALSRESCLWLAAQLLNAAHKLGES